MAKMIFFILLICSTVNTTAQVITEVRGRYYLGDVKLTNKEIRQLMALDEETRQWWNTYKDLELFGSLMAGGMAGSWFVYGLQYLFEGEGDQGLLYGCLGLTVATIGCAVPATNLRRKAILKFNQGLKNEVSINVSPTMNGIGLVVQLGK